MLICNNDVRFAVSIYITYGNTNGIQSRREVNLWSKGACSNGTGRACIPENRNSIAQLVCKNDVRFAVSIHITYDNVKWGRSRREVNLGSKGKASKYACVPENRNSITVPVCNNEVWFAISIHITYGNAIGSRSRRKVNLWSKGACSNGTGKACVSEYRNSITGHIYDN